MSWELGMSDLFDLFEDLFDVHELRLGLAGRETTCMF